MLFALQKYAVISYCQLLLPINLASMVEVVGIGNSLVDILVQIDDDSVLQAMRLPKGSMHHIERARFDEIKLAVDALPHTQASGGSASNTMKALAGLGVDSAFVGKVGDDALGAFYESDLRRFGVDVRLAKQASGSTGMAVTFISPDGQRTFATYLGVSAELAVSDVPASVFPAAGYFYVEGYLVQDPAMLEGVLSLARRAGLTVCMDLASYNVVADNRDFFARILSSYVDVVFANSEEATAFTGLGASESVDELASLCRIAVVKLGAGGACVRSGNFFDRVEALPVAHVVDTTGAGDYFAAGFLYRLMRGCGLHECLFAGTRLAAEIIQVVGATLPASRWDCLIKTL